MDKNKVFEFYEKIYFKELEEMNVVLSRFPILIAGAALIVNAYIFLFNFDMFKQLWNIYWKVTLILIIIVAFSGLLYCLYKTFESNTYEFTSDLDELESKRVEYQEYVINVKANNLTLDREYRQEEEDAEELFQKNLKDQFIKATKINRASNCKRRLWFHKSLFMIWINLIVCIMIPILVMMINIWSSNMAEEQKKPTLIPRPAPAETVSVRNNIPTKNDGYSDKGQPKRPNVPQKNENKK